MKVFGALLASLFVSVAASAAPKVVGVPFSGRPSWESSRATRAGGVPSPTPPPPPASGAR